MVLRMAKLRRRKSGAWGARITIPEDVRVDYQTIYKRRHEEIFYAPPDCTPQRAQVLFSEWQAEIKNRIDTLRRKQRSEGHDLTQKDARALAGEWYKGFLGQHEANPGRPRDWQGTLWAFEDVVEEAARDPDTGEIGVLDMEDPETRKYFEEQYPYLTETATQFLTSRGEALTPAAMTLFLTEMIKELHTAMVRLGCVAGGDYSPDRHLQTLPEYRKAEHKAVPQSAARPGRAAGVASCKTAMRLFERYITAKQPAGGTVRRWRGVFLVLDAYLAGRDFDVLSDDEAQRWVTSLVTKKRSAATVMNIYVTALKALGRWATKQRHIARNPFEGCSVPVPKKSRHRETQAYNPEETRLYLSAASAVKNTRTPGMAARRWVPWICAYNGARAGEITQLRGQDVIERDGIKALLLTPDAGPLKTRQARVAPLHEHLIAQGFLDYVKVKGKGPLFYNPAPNAATAPTDPTKPKTRRAVQARNQLAAWARSIGITDKEVGPTHGWRHLFKQIADRHGISERVSDAITGHAPLTEGRKYGAPRLEDMAEALKKFPRYKIDDQTKTALSASEGPESQSPQPPLSPANGR
jgi:integrase